MSSTESTQKIILALLVVASILLLGPYVGISIFGRAMTQARPALDDRDTEGVSRPVSGSAAKSADLELEMPDTEVSQTHRPPTGQSKKELSDIEDLLKK